MIRELGFIAALPIAAALESGCIYKNCVTEEHLDTYHLYVAYGDSGPTDSFAVAEDGLLIWHRDYASKTMTKLMYPNGDSVDVNAGETASNRYTTEAQNIQRRFDQFVLNGNTCRE